MLIRYPSKTLTATVGVVVQSVYVPLPAAGSSGWATGLAAVYSAAAQAYRDFSPIAQCAVMGTKANGFPTGSGFWAKDLSLELPLWGGVFRSESAGEYTSTGRADMSVYRSSGVTRFEGVRATARSLYGTLVLSPYAKGHSLEA